MTKPRLPPIARDLLTVVLFVLAYVALAAPTALLVLGCDDANWSQFYCGFAYVAAYALDFPIGTVLSPPGMAFFPLHCIPNALVMSLFYLVLRHRLGRRSRNVEGPESF